MSRRPVLFVTRELPSLAQRRLESLKTVEVRQHNSPLPISRQQLLEGVNAADGLICLLSEKIDKELLQATSRGLKVISTVSVGYDHVDIPALKSHGGIKLGYTPDVLTDATADTTVLLALMASRRAKEALQIVATGAGTAFSLSRGLGTQFTNKTLGIVGFGRIGCATAQRLLPFGFSRILYSASRAHEERAKPLGAQYAPFDQILAESDLICICCPLNERTKGMFDKQAFSKMKKEAILVNSARGAIVNQDDLVEALDSEQLAHAALDVTVPEPIPADHPLVKHPRCTILPHIGSATEETRNDMANLAIDNALAGIFGEPLKAEVSL
ncbi:glyoxylate reductase [Martensiomyces pterosporus]|nr:glyoxylate reductase [Martensiomyces pterosporus]